MTHVLTARERKVLDKLSFDHGKFLIKGQFPTGCAGDVTLNNLVRLGLAETGPSERYYGTMGWRITDDGWRCMYGKSYAEIMTGGQHRPLRVWSWPPST
ncbi:MAG: hypothetical protein AB7P12_08125 [Alphaproteobacteria bacterium]